MDLTHTVLAFVGGIGLAIVLYWLAQRIFNRFLRRRSLTARSRIAKDTISLAIDQRSIFRLEVQSGEFKGYKAQGFCLELADTWLMLDMGGEFSVTQWDGEDVTVLFETAFKRKASFFQFRTHVLDIRKKANGILLRLAMPTHLDPGQKRSFLRISPYKESILAMGLWPLSDEDPLPTTVRKLPPAFFNYRPGRPETLHLNNISAGGMRFGISAAVTTEQMEEFDKGSQLLALLLLKPMHEGKKPLALWLTCSITAAGQAEDNFRYLGACFTNWANVEQGHEEISWFPVNKDKSVAPLATWVMRHHMEQNRMI